ncbi:hypothetical protein [Hymenobacter sp. YC55]|uniref:hypothetical protein n=1 Tax=Hymenobacter sp. YC55 TaxID=3034019 RepID=UPI0023F671DA|nr:hypothetical protein [Hymenobacter sp. YC55]MDF7815042.1 hypothetical protein [Hymenobacter sp. YC55]
MNSHFVDAFLDGMALLGGRNNKQCCAANQARSSANKQRKVGRANGGFLPCTVSVFAVLGQPAATLTEN